MDQSITEPKIAWKFVKHKIDEADTSDISSRGDIVKFHHEISMSSATLNPTGLSLLDKGNDKWSQFLEPSMGKLRRLQKITSQWWMKFSIP